MDLRRGRSRMAMGKIAGGLLLVAVVVAAAAAQESTLRQSARSGKDKTQLREGARLLDREGTLAERGERWVFTPDSEKEGFTLLENQTLERMTSAASNSTQEQKWSVSGVVTEFQGNHYLLLERAVLLPPPNVRLSAE